jgi:alpha-D-ribose 1-methylphosphonate 5-triphosphate diphosphatase PhnM
VKAGKDRPWQYAVEKVKKEGLRTRERVEDMHTDLLSTAGMMAQTGVQVDQIGQVLGVSGQLDSAAMDRYIGAMNLAKKHFQTVERKNARVVKDLVKGSQKAGRADLEQRLRAEAEKMDSDNAKVLAGIASGASSGSGE